MRPLTFDNRHPFFNHWYYTETTFVISCSKFYWFSNILNFHIYLFLCLSINFNLSLPHCWYKSIHISLLISISRVSLSYINVFKSVFHISVYSYVYHTLLHSCLSIIYDTIHIYSSVSTTWQPRDGHEVNV